MANDDYKSKFKAAVDEWVRQIDEMDSKTDGDVKWLGLDAQLRMSQDAKDVPYVPIELPNDYMVDLDGMWCGVEESSSNKDIYEIAKGEELDKLAELWGLKRKVDMGDTESDAEFRIRIKERIKEDSKPPELPAGKTQAELEKDRMRDFFFPKKDSSAYRKCTCGLDSTKSGGRHSDWCEKKGID